MHSKKPHGFTLIEVLVALVILSIALLALAGLMATTTKNNAAGGHLSEAATYAQDMLERIRSIPVDTLVGAIAAGALQTDQPALGSTGTPYYTRTWSYETVPVPNSPQFLEKITITVSWADPQSHSITITTSNAE